MIVANGGSGQPAVERLFTMYFCVPATKTAAETRVKGTVAVL